MPPGRLGRAPVPVTSATLAALAGLCALALGELGVVTEPTADLALLGLLGAASVAGLALVRSSGRAARVRPEVTVFCAVALLLVALHAVSAAAAHPASPPETDPTTGLAFDGESLRTVAVLTTSYLHVDAGHLLGNLVGFALYGGAALLVCARLGRRRWFRITAIALLVALPVLKSVASVLVQSAVLDGVAGHIGFSTVVSGFAGFLAVALAAYLLRAAGARAVVVGYALLATAAAGLLVARPVVPDPGLGAELAVTRTLVLLALSFALAALPVLAGRAWLRVRGRLAGVTAEPVVAVAAFALLAAAVSLFSVEASLAGNVLAHGLPVVLGAVLSVVTYIGIGERGRTVDGVGATSLDGPES